MLRTVTLKSWFSDPGIIRQKHQFRTPHITSFASKLIDVLSHSGFRVTHALPKIYGLFNQFNVIGGMNYTSKNPECLTINIRTHAIP